MLLQGAPADPLPDGSGLGGAAAHVLALRLDLAHQAGERHERCALGAEDLPHERHLETVTDEDEVQVRALEPLRMVVAELADGPRQHVGAVPLSERPHERRHHIVLREAELPAQLPRVLRREPIRVEHLRIEEVVADPPVDDVTTTCA